MNDDATVTKKDIVDKLTGDIGIPKTNVKDVVQGTLNMIIDSLLADERVELRNFGVFRVKTRGPRKARNPKTNEEILIPTRKVITFKPGKYMMDLLYEKNNSKR